MKEDQPKNDSEGKPQPSTSDHQSPRQQSEKNGNSPHNSLEVKEWSSTNLNQNPKQDIHLRSVYVLCKNILQGTKITANIRARIRGFIMDQSAKQLITRDTCTLACTYVDLYLYRKGHCEVEDIQIVAIACLMVARKHQEGKLPTISFNIFSKEALQQWERKVVKRLEYQLCPPTYNTYAEHIVLKWDLFPSREGRFDKKFGRCRQGPNMILRLFYQQLDCLFLVPETLKWDLQLVVLNMFYLHAFLLNVPHIFIAHQLSNQQFIQCFYSQQNEFKSFFEQFLNSYSLKKHFRLDIQLGCYLKMFLSLKASRKQFAVLNGQPRYNSLREWDKLQTYTKESYDLAKAVMEKIKKK